MFLVTAYQLASFEKPYEPCGRVYLPPVRPEYVGKGEEGLDPAVVGFKGHHCDPVCPFGKPVALDQRPDSMGAHDLGPVQQGKALLGLQGNGLPSHLIPYFLTLPDFASVEHFAESYQGEAQVGEGSEVSGCPQGSLLVNHGQYIVVEHVQ